MISDNEKNTASEELNEEKTECISEEEATEDKKTEDVTTEELESLRSQLTRLQADFANYKTRSRKEALDSVNLGVEKLAEAIFPVIDNFEIALSHMDPGDMRDGVQMIYEQLIQALKDNGISVMEDVNKVFDPNRHYAVVMDEIEGVDSGIVTEVLKTGFIRGEKILRPAMVKVSK